MSPLTDDQNASRRMLGISIDTALMVHGFELLSPEQVECLMDPEREPEARGMVMDIADRVITSPTVSDFLHRVLAECLPVDPDDPDEGTAAYGGWDHDDTIPAFNGIMPPTLAALTDEFSTWMACNGFDHTDGDAGDILRLGRITHEQRQYLKRFIARWEQAEKDEPEREAQAAWLDKMGMGPVAVLS